MTAFDQASKRYADAEREFIAASDELSALLGQRVEAVKSQHRIAGHHRRNWDESAELAQRVLALRAAKPKATQRGLARELGISRDLVCYYLNPRCKARFRN